METTPFDLKRPGCRKRLVGHSESGHFESSWGDFLVSMTRDDVRMRAACGKGRREGLQADVTPSYLSGRRNNGCS